MSFFIVKCFPKLLMGLALSGALQVGVAQEPDYFRASRSLHVQVGRPVSGVLQANNPVGSSFCPLNFHKELMDSFETVPSSSVLLPIHRPGGIAKISPSEVLIGGYEYTNWANFSGRGKLVFVRMGLDASSKPVPTIVSSSILQPNLDPIQVVWLRVAQKVVVLNHLDRKVYVGDWDGDPSALPTKFAPIIDETQVPILRFLATLRIAILDSRDGFCLCSPDSDAYWEVKRSGNQWVAQKLFRSQAGAELFIKNLEFLSQKGSPSICLSSAAYGSIWQLILEADQSYINGGVVQLNSMQQLPNEDAFQVNPGSEFSYQFAFKGSSTYHKFFFMPFVRYGAPSFDDDLRIDKAFFVERPKVGNTNFGICAFLKCLSPGARVVSGYLNVAQRNPDGTDPVDIQGSDALLIPNLILPFTIDVNQFGSSLGVRYPIPFDPNLDGTVFLFQFVMELNDGGMVWSDIVGTRIHPSQGEGAPLGPSYSFKSSRKKVDFVSGYKILNAGTRGTPNKRTAKIWARLFPKLKKIRNKRRK
jgi:hypothetical protein